MCIAFFVGDTPLRRPARGLNLKLMEDVNGDAEYARNGVGEALNIIDASDDKLRLTDIFINCEQLIVRFVIKKHQTRPKQDMFSDVYALASESGATGA